MACRQSTNTPGKTPIAIKTPAGEPVESDQRANTFAEYLDKVFFDIICAGIHPEENQNLGAPLPIDTDNSTME